MKNLIFILSVLFLALGTMDAYSQNWFKKVGDKATDTAKRRVEQKVEEKTRKAVDDAFDGKIGKDKKSKKDSKKSDKKTKNGKNNEVDEVYDDGEDKAVKSKPQKAQSPEITHAKIDFVPGDDVFFVDSLANEPMGEFPSMWDLKSGNAEVASVNGVKCINLVGKTTITPFMEEKHYLPDVFTLELDVLYPVSEEGVGTNDGFHYSFYDALNNKVIGLTLGLMHPSNKTQSVSYDWINGESENEGQTDLNFKRSEFNHIAISFNKRALKVYVNGSRVVNIPRCNAPAYFTLYGETGARGAGQFITNIRIAKGK